MSSSSPPRPTPPRASSPPFPGPTKARLPGAPTASSSPTSTAASRSMRSTAAATSPSCLPREENRAISPRNSTAPSATRSSRLMANRSPFSRSMIAPCIQRPSRSATAVSKGWSRNPVRLSLRTRRPATRQSFGRPTIRPENSMHSRGRHAPQAHLAERRLGRAAAARRDPRPGNQRQRRRRCSRAAHAAGRLRRRQQVSDAVTNSRWPQRPGRPQLYPRAATLRRAKATQCST